MPPDGSVSSIPSSAYRLFSLSAAKDFFKYHSDSPIREKFLRDIRDLEPGNPDEERTRLSKLVNPLVDASKSPVCSPRERTAAIRLYNFLVETNFENSGSRPPLGEIANFRRISATLSAGSQPTNAGFAWLAMTKHKTIMTLRNEDPSDLELKAWPQLKLVQNTMPDRKVPSFKQVEEFLDFVDNPANGPVYIHCRAGTGRTGLLVACYRIARQEWSAEDALKEAASFDIRGDIDQEQKSFVRDFEAYWKSRHPAAGAKAA